MRQIDVLDKEDRELNSETFYQLLPEEIHSRYHIQSGKDPYDRSKDMVIFDSWEAVTQVNAAINGWIGGNVANLWPSEELNNELNKAEGELEITRRENPDHFGTICRLERRIKELINLSAYKRWMHENGFEEISISNFDFDCGFNDEYEMCCSCYVNIVRTKQDSYSWTAPLFIDCEGFVCEECVDTGELDEYILDEYKNVVKSIPDEFDLDRLGLVKINEEWNFFRGNNRMILVSYQR